MKYLRKLLIMQLVRLRITIRKITKTIQNNNRIRRIQMIILSLQWWLQRHLQRQVKRFRLRR